jgi:hypothetical protein
MFASGVNGGLGICLNNHSLQRRKNPVLTVRTEETLLPLLEATPLDHMLYLALADLAEESGDVQRARVWRMFYYYRVCPYTDKHNNRRFCFLHSKEYGEFEVCHKWTELVSEDGEPWTCISSVQGSVLDLLGPRGKKTRLEAILALLECVLKHPKAFEKELGRV